MEIKDLLDTLGIEASNVDEFKANFQSKFIPKTQAWEDDEVRSKATGAVTFTINQFAKKKFGLSNDEIKGKKYEEVLELGYNKLNEKIAELETVANSNNDQVIKDLQEKLEKASKSINDYKSQIDTTKQQAESIASEWSNKYKSLKVNNELNNAKSKVMPKLKDMTEAERFYFEHKLKDTFAIDFDENDNPIVIDKAGKRLANPNKMGEFLSIDEAIEQVAIQEKFIKVNNAAQTNVNAILANNPIVTTAVNNNSANGRKLNPKAVQNLNALQQK